MAINRENRAKKEKLFKPREWKIIDDQAVEISDLVVHSFAVGDAEDPDLYASEPLIKWQESEAGQWVIEHAVETPFWHRTLDTSYYGHRYYIVARMTTKDQTFFKLKYQS